MKKSTKAILGATLTTGLCLSLIAGSTYALFSSRSEVNLAFGSAELKVTATAADIDGISTVYNAESGELEEKKTGNEENGGKFATKGIWQWREADRTIELQRMVPGDGIEFNLNITNDSNVSIKYRTELTIVKRGNETEEGVDGEVKPLANVLEVTFGKDEDASTVTVGNSTLITQSWVGPIDPDSTEDLSDQYVKVMFPYSDEEQNEYQGQEVEIKIGVYAVQSTAHVVDAEGDLVIYNAVDFRNFALSVDEGNDYAGKTVSLGGNIDLSEVGATFMPHLVAFADTPESEWEPIGDSTHAFKGTFEGNNFKISGLNVTGQAAALFGATEGATIQNLTIVNANVTATDGGKAGILVAEAKGSLTVNNVTIESSSVTADTDRDGGHPTYVGALVGTSDGTVTVTDSNIQTESGAVLAGSVPAGGLTMEGDVTVADNSGKEKDLSCLETGWHDFGLEKWEGYDSRWHSTTYECISVCKNCGTQNPFYVKVGNSWTGSWQGDDGEWEIRGCPEGITDLKIPGKINGQPVRILYDAFKNNTELETVEFGEGMWYEEIRRDGYSTRGTFSIGDGAFSGCTNLREIKFPQETPFTICYDAFYNCSSLTKIVIPEGCQWIGSEAFRSCSADVTILGKTHISEGCFSGIKSITFGSAEKQTQITHADIENGFAYQLRKGVKITFYGTQEMWNSVFGPQSDTDADPYFTLSDTEADEYPIQVTIIGEDGTETTKYAKYTGDY